MQASIQQRLTTVAACALAVCALLPFLVTFLPRLYFDVDPASPLGMVPITALGPAALAAFCALAAGLSAAILVLCAWMKRPIAWWAVALVAVGVVVQLLHLRPARPDNLWYGSAWIAAALLGLAAYHLAQLPGARRWLIAAFVAVILPVTIDSVHYVFVEQPMTEAAYQQQPDALAQPGGDYERRLAASDAIGAFSLSNVLGSLTAALTLIAVGVGLGLKRHGPRIAAALCAVAGAATVYLTNSRGAAAALIAGFLVLLLARWVKRRAVVAAVSLALVIAAIAAVLVATSWGPPGEGGGGARLTLLFRGQYWQGAAPMAAEHPFLGIGQEGFRETYLRTKNPISPEDVRSAHNVFVDWIAMLGVGGWAWAALAIAWLVLAARVPQAEEDEPPGFRSRELWLPCAATAGVLFLTQYTVEFAIYGSMIGKALLWLAGLLAFVCVMAWAAATKRDARWVGAGLAASAAALLIHNQIEMTFHHAPSAIPAWVLLATAAGMGANPTRSARRWDAAAALLPLGAAVALIVMAVIPATAQQEHLARAAEAWRAGWGERTIEELDASTQYVPADHVTLRWRQTLRLRRAGAMEAAGYHERAQTARREALALCVPEAFGGVDSYRLDAWRSTIYAELGELNAAIAAQQRVVERTPYSLDAHLRLAVLLERAGRTADAVAAYQALLQLDDQLDLDPAKQLAPAQRARAEAYIAAHQR